MNNFPTYKIKESLADIGFIYLYMELEEILTPICIYPKNEKENLTYEELAFHLEQTQYELNKLL